ncbi:phage tail tube protein [Streptomyces cavernae]|uniref:phage tail tube protein n=1 Tax=Streptomyces cavernae TaxID=2259034 RepID=UPI000FEBEA50|nr:phage tail tube protein [Streptomyces cavernae]
MVATYASTKQFVGIAPEAAQGTPVAMTATQLLTTFTPSDKPTYLKDQSWHGSMGTDAFAHILGTGTADISLGGPVYGDTAGYWLRNILGDVAVTGTPTGSGATTLSTSAAAGATSITTAATIAAGTLVQIGTGATAEVVTTGAPSGSGPYTIPITSAGAGLAYAHASTQAVTPVQPGGPFTYAWSLLNSGGGQPPSHSITHYLGPTAGTGARQYPGFCLSQYNFTFNAESELLAWTGQGTSWPSAIASAAPTAAPTTVLPTASWRTRVGIGGPASGGTLVQTVTDGEVNLTRELQPVFTANGSRTPYVIHRGGLTVAGKLNFSAVSDESVLLYMLNNTQPPVQIVCDNGLAGNAQIIVQLDMQSAAFTQADPDTSKAAVGYQASFEANFNTTNAGGSGGMSPIKVSVTCAVPPGSF